MTGKQHLSFGIITGIAFSAYLHKLNICQNNADMVFVVCGSVLGSLLPDIDSTESIISNILPPFTTLISKIINNVVSKKVEDVCWKKTNKYCFLYFCCISHKRDYFSDNALISVQKKSNCMFSVILIMKSEITL